MGAAVALSKRKLSPYFLFALLLLLAWASYRIVGVFLDYVLLGLFLAYLTFPGYAWVKARIRNAQIASIVMLVAVTAIVLIPLAFLVAQLVEEIRHIIVALQVGSVDELVERVTRAVNEFLGRPQESGGTVALLVDNGVLAVQERLSRLAGSLPERIASGVVGIFVLLYVMYYVYTDGHRMLDYVRDTLPMQESHRDLLFYEVGNVIRAVMFGSVLTALIQAILGGIGFLIFGVPGVIFWSVIMFILALLPIVGPPLVWVPASFYLFATRDSPFAAVGLFVYSLIMVSTIDNLIRPKLIGSRAHVHPVIILLGVLGGIVVFGFSGFILGPLVLSIFMTILNVYRKEFALKMEDEEDTLSRLGSA